MYSFSFFDGYDYLIVIVLIIITIVFTYYIIKKSKEASIQKINPILLSTIGIIVILGSIFLFVSIEQSADSTSIELLKPASALASKPMVHLSIALFLLGCVLIISSIYRNINSKNNLEAKHSADVE